MKKMYVACTVCVCVCVCVCNTNNEKPVVSTCARRSGLRERRECSSAAAAALGSLAY